MENKTINSYYKVTKITSVSKNEDGSKNLIESEWVGKHTVKEIK